MLSFYKTSQKYFRFYTKYFPKTSGVSSPTHFGSLPENFFLTSRKHTITSGRTIPIYNKICCKCQAVYRKCIKCCNLHTLTRKYGILRLTHFCGNIQGGKAAGGNLDTFRTFMFHHLSCII